MNNYLINPLPSLSNTRKASLISSSVSVSFIFLAIIVRNSGKSIVPFPFIAIIAKVRKTKLKYDKVMLAKGSQILHYEFIISFDFLNNFLISWVGWTMVWLLTFFSYTCRCTVHVVSISLKRDITRFPDEEKFLILSRLLSI